MTIDQVATIWSGVILAETWQAWFDEIPMTWLPLGFWDDASCHPADALGHLV